MADSEKKEDRAIVDWDQARQETIDGLIAQRDMLAHALRICEMVLNQIPEPRQIVTGAIEQARSILKDLPDA